MQKAQQDDWAATVPGLQQSLAQTQQRRQPDTLYMSANASGPVDPHGYYESFSSTSSTAPFYANSASPPRGEDYEVIRSYSQSPERIRHRRTSNTLLPPMQQQQQQRLNSARSQPVLNGKPSARVKDLADKFDQETSNGGIPTSPRTANERYRRQLPVRSTTPRSPTSPPRSEASAKKLHKRKPVNSTTPNTSFDTASSFSSDATVISTKSQPVYPARKIQARVKHEPLFGEITSDGQWNGNFDFLGYTTPTDYFSASRRGSDGDLAVGSRRHSQTDFYHPGYFEAANTLSHKRSRSDMTSTRSTLKDRLPMLDLRNLPPFAPTTLLPDGMTTSPTAASHPSRIPVRGRRSAGYPVSPVTPRSSSAIPTATFRPKTPRIPTDGKENAKQVGQTKRYNPPTLPQSTQLLSAKVVAPPPKVSPPLRSSRPRQPVSSATTAASRARAASALAAPNSPSTKRPSEQWLGKPYDPKQERSKRKIPELGKVDFAERRARIQKAISQNLEQSQSLESLRTRSRAASKASEQQTASGTEEKANIVDQHQANELDRETEALGLTSKLESAESKQPLTLKTTDLPAKSSRTDLNTAATEFTEFEFDESPSSARTVQENTAQTSAGSVLELPTLSAATYQPPQRKKIEVEPQPDQPVASSVEDSPSDIEDRWGLKRTLGDHGSIKIMLDDHPKLAYIHQVRAQKDQPMEQHSPIDESEGAVADNAAENTIEQNGPPEDIVLSPSTFRSEATSQDTDTSFIMRAINAYRDTGVVAPELIQKMDDYTVDLYRISANGGSDALLVQNLLDSIAAQKHTDEAHHPNQTLLPLTPHTPASVDFDAGTAIVYAPNSFEITPERRSHDAVVGSDDEDDFAAQIRRADEDWERQDRGVGPMFDDEDGPKPHPPPKDDGYTPHSSVGPENNLVTAWTANSHHEIALDRLSGRNSSSKNVDSVISEEAVIAASVVLPPSHAPPLPPALPFGIQDSPRVLAASPEYLINHSPHMRKTFSGVGSNSSRPSSESQRQLPAPASQSMTSFGESPRIASSDAGADKALATSPSPEQKRLQKRRHIIRELLDTENTYHQDLKIIEDIYKATVVEIVTPEDKKILFGNCDEIERFSLQFYDQLRKAVSAMYTPTKNHRWGARRGSMSTTQSDATGQGSVFSSEPVDEERDRSTFIGKVFLDNLTRMEQLYGSYLRNHDAANQRLSALQTTPTVKCWLDECHNNASDITSAWDLDSLLVKPTQRVSKYPLILQQLLETTPAKHPDHEALKSAVTDTIAMLTRINEAKKRSDLVEQMIGGKNKDTDVRSGLAKAFGRRTERLKERVGISEAFQDPDFDALAQSFGGHYIRLQVTMRDFQDYVNQVDKAIQNTNSIASALELFTDVHQSRLPEIESKWRRYGQIIRELTTISLTAHKLAVQKRMITPLIALIKIHESPQKAIAKRKKHIVDYARCKSIEKRGEKPDKKTLEASEMYEALNDQLKIELPKLYDMTAQLVIACLRCFLDSQLEWQKTWERKLQPLLNASEVPKSIQEILPAFTADYELVKSELSSLALCNGSILADTANFLSSDILDLDFKRGSETPSLPSSKRQSRTYTPEVPPTLEMPSMPQDTRLRSNSSMSHNASHTPITPIVALTAANRPWSNSVTTPPSSAYNTRPSTATQSQSMSTFTASVRSSIEPQGHNKHDSTATYVTAQADLSDASNHRFSGIFSSAMPPESSEASYGRALSPTPASRAAEDTKVLFVCASLFEFNIDKARKEAGYPYLTYEQGEVFDVIAQKGELWLAKNQDDAEKTLGWIWEQHFIVLGQD